MTKFNTLKNIYSKLLNKSVANANHLITPSLHTLLSPFLINKSLKFGAKEIKPFVHSLFIQSKGSGKGETQKVMKSCIESAELKGKIVNSFTSAGIIGSIKQKRNKLIYIKKLQELDFIGIDEGSQITNDKNPHAKTLKMDINGYLDNNHITKEMKDGTLDYDGLAVMNIGTFFEDSIKETILTDGFFDRFFISFKLYDRESLSRMRRNIDLIASSENVEESERIRFDFEIILKELKKKRDHKKIYCLSNEISDYFGTNFENLINSLNIDDELPTSKISTFEQSLVRAKILCYKLMIQYSSIEEDDEISKDSVDYALECIKEHLTSYICLLNNISNKENRYREQIDEAKNKDKAIDILKNIIRNNPDFSKSKFKTELYQRDDFPIGFGIRKLTEGKSSLITELINKGIIRLKEKKSNGEQILELSE